MSLLVIGFFDLSGSTKSAERMGSEAAAEAMLTPFQIACQGAIRRAGGKHIKALGDGALGTFESTEAALEASALLIEMLNTHPVPGARPQQLRIALYNGETVDIPQDVLGVSVNRPAKLLKLVPKCGILCNSQYQVNLESMKPKLKSLFSSAGVKFPNGERAIILDWKKYFGLETEKTLHAVIRNGLKAAEVHMSIDTKDLLTPGAIWWPVVPRAIPTAIHRCQLEILRLLSRLGWEVNLLVADCGLDASLPNSDQPKLFAAALKVLCTKRGVSLARVKFLSKLFSASGPEREGVQARFQRIAENMTVQDLQTVNTKKYGSSDLAAMSGQPALKYLRPVLTSAAICYLIDNMNGTGACQTLVMAGLDEEIQWNLMRDASQMTANIGLVLNPILSRKENGGDTVTELQKARWPSWSTQGSLASALSEPLLKTWITRAFIQVPSITPDSAVLANGEQERAFDLEPSRVAEIVWPLVGE